MVKEEGEVNKIISDSKFKESALEVSPLYANRYYVYSSSGITRISFGEIYPGNEEKYHSSIAMTTEVAENLAHLILKVIETNTSNDDKAKKEETPEGALAGIR